MGRIYAGGSAPSSGGSGGGSGGSSTTIKAINKTGAVINEGDKVWLQKDAQVSGDGFATKTTLDDYASFITRTGNCIYSQGDNKFYSITSSGLTEIQTLSTTAKCLKYMDNGTTFLADTSSTTTVNYRIDENLVASLPNNYYPICEDLFMKYNTNWYLYKLNLDTFEEVSGGWYFENNALTTSNIFKIGNKLYVKDKMFRLPEGGGTIPSGTTGITVTGLPSSQKYLGVTSDGKYLLVCNNNSLTSGGNLTIYEVVSEITFRLVQPTELPPEFEQFYNGVSNPVCIFNPYTGILTCVKKGTNDYLVAKYENGSWSVLPITINVAENHVLQWGITTPDDLNRVGYGNIRSGASQRCGAVLNLETTSGYAVIPYKTYNINSDVLTGKATTSADLNGTVEVATILPNEVDVTVTVNEDNVELTME